MLIQSQDRHVVIDMTGIVLRAEAVGFGYNIVAYGNRNDPDGEVLGSYADKERALRVLNNICTNYTNLCSNSEGSCICAVYEMPQE